MDDSTAFITIPHTSLESALETAEYFGATFGKDCLLEPESHNLRISLDLVDTKIVEDLERSPASPSTPQKFSPTRTDFTLELDTASQARLAEIELVYLQEWEAANGDRTAQQSAYRDRQSAIRQLRLQFLSSLVEPAANGGTLIYGGWFPNAVSLDYPDGQWRQVETLIHFAHPISPEDLYLRECRVSCDRIIRYHIPGLDDAEWIRQNEPRQRLDAAKWRSLLLQRYLA
jgi:hypothetical protein